jgi:three-Cys-motif partner protein
MSTLPPMEPHTAAKHLILRRYLDAWFPILGKHHDTINYIDGFAGPGEYETGEDGSPIIALKSALQHAERGTLRSAVRINFVFIEADPEFLSHLRQRIEAMQLPPTFRVHTSGRTFEEEIQSMLSCYGPGAGVPAPTFAFVDPFGFKGIPFDAISKLLSLRHCEAFINIMVEFINRFLDHPNDKVVAHFPQTFGTEDVCHVAPGIRDRKQALLDLYRAQLKKAARYVGRFDMENKRHKTIYSLFFASNSESGFEKMKEAMWAVDPNAGGFFSDADPRGLFAFDLFATQPLLDEMLARFRGKLVPMYELEQFVLRETDYLPKHARDHLKQLESAEKIEVAPIMGYKRRRFSYPSDKVSIRFK